MDAKYLERIILSAWLLLWLNPGFSQPSLLKKEVSVSFENTSTEKILIYLSNEVGFNFSYNSDIINVDTLVSFHGQNVSLDDVLKSILPEGVQYKESGDYLILVKKRSRESKNAKNTRYEIKGYIYDYESGNAIANVTIFDATAGGTYVPVPVPVPVHVRLPVPVRVPVPGMPPEKKHA